MSLANTWSAVSSVREAEGTGFGSKAERLPKSKVNGIALGGFINLCQRCSQTQRVLL